MSKEAGNQLNKLFPSMKNKIEHFPNILPSDLLESSYGKGFDDNFNGLRILTVGRLSKEKGQDLIISVMARLIDEGLAVKWYCLGDGSSRKEYEEKINHYNLKESFLLLGSNPNPYPFIKQCDVYVQPSKHEGYCITLAEARKLCKPIITTDFIAAREQIVHGKTGLIVPYNELLMYQALKRLVNDQKLRAMFTSNLQKEMTSAFIDIGKIIDA